MDKRIVNGIAILATLLWTVSFILDAVYQAYEPPVSVHAVMLTVAGAAFGGSILKRPSDSSDDQNGRGKK